MKMRKRKRTIRNGRASGQGKKAYKEQSIEEQIILMS